MKATTMRDRLTHTLEVPVNHVVFVEILYGVRYIKDLTKG